MVKTRREVEEMINEEREDMVLRMMETGETSAEKLSYCSGLPLERILEIVSQR